MILAENHCLSEYIRRKIKAEKSEKEEDRIKTENTIATSLAAIFFGIASFSIPVIFIWSEKIKDDQMTQFVFYILSSSSLIACALFIDSVLDNLERDWRYRLKMMSHGYLLFCTLISFMCILILSKFYLAIMGCTEYRWHPELNSFFFLLPVIMWKTFSLHDSNISATWSLITIYTLLVGNIWYVWYTGTSNLSCNSH